MAAVTSDERSAGVAAPIAARATTWSGSDAVLLDVESSTAGPSVRAGHTGCIGPPQAPLDGANEVSGGNWTNQQAPGFWAQKSSNCWASEPAGGAVSLLALSGELVLVSGEVVPPLAVSPDVVPVPVLPVVSVPVELELLSELVLSVDVLLSELLLLFLLFAAAAAAGAWLDTGIATSAGGPGTCGAAGSLPPQPAATSVRSPTVMIRARRVTPISLTPP
jgi:hypothetical protein